MNEFKNQKDIQSYINSLKNCVGYLQISNEDLKEHKQDRIWKQKSDINVDFSSIKGFVYEAYFFDETFNRSIAIRQINSAWLVDETNLSDKDIQSDDEQIYLSNIDGLLVKMVQIWQEQPDEFCLNLQTLKLQKVVFAGFVNKEKK
ncbi:TIGR04423 family type III CRISPR-associated protein [Campylobacter hyointestinalis]|uniref:TIGR04423 family type III CRISPR-associated protein n=1 Tax=Campylobacter hyointestinalis TaxID=198 RepID=UPI000CE463DA|nr:TIGR04423 family type III CRISPR-associated protein [Campylobacter hyointestinalis]PPB74364.1 TIGR04423 family type III CRISPR-associated protein [Campylobacter hyointestinalis subsp. hyointestinalis]PPB74932.1 TIGR04423 family type III CRISPR-associated protein [Campylobacter hyointestinalis subsp. hyointestinalis]PPB77605.1 TIGR04423 family type III CRISPR-associated protein [Campylobacter hyointestinalis subsp. hyointestinalis]PPB78805.1 TIGR04423 family type III CRISPR-associated protein